MKKIGIVVPTTYQQTYTKFWMQTCKIQAEGFRAGYDCEIFVGSGYIPAEMHNHGIEQAMAWGADSIFISGTDELHPINSIAWFDALPVDIVVPVILQRSFPYFTCLYRTTQFMEGDETVNAPAGIADLPDDFKDPLLEVECAGSGGMFVRRKVFEKVPFPWFEDIFDMSMRYPFTHRILGHDIVFGLKAIQAGFKTYGDLRMNSGHMNLEIVDKQFKRKMAGEFWAQQKSEGLKDAAG